MLSWIESFAVGFVTGSVVCLATRVVYSVLTWRYKRYKQISDACDKIDNAFGARETRREEHS